MPELLSIVFILAGYLAGSVSTAIITCRLMGLPDPRSEGSGNPGATNVLRIGGKKAAALTLFGDMLKGYLPVFIASQFSSNVTLLALTGLAAFLGHLYPVFFGFKGGKGVATALGVFFGLDGLLGLAVAGTWLLTSLLTRISSLSALVAAALGPVYMWLWGFSLPPVIIVIVMVLLLYWRHRDNIQRLLSGEEARIGSKQ
jgi:glycerol-3-phosphate acyltransferase PlsY